MCVLARGQCKLARDRFALGFPGIFADAGAVALLAHLLQAFLKLGDAFLGHPNGDTFGSSANRTAALALDSAFPIRAQKQTSTAIRLCTP